MELQTVLETDNLILLALKSEQSGDMAGALRLARQALEVAKLPVEYARALTAVARYRFRLGQYETARQLAQEARAMTDPTCEPQAAIHAEALLMLGMCAVETNSMAEGEQYYRSAADLAREIGHTLLFQRALHNLGSGVYLFRGQYDLAIAYQITGQRTRTHETLDELRFLARPGSGGEGYACYVSGMLALDEDDFQTAEAELTQALTLAEALGDPSLNLDTRLGISRTCWLRGDRSKALTWAEDALSFAQRVGYRIYQGRAHLKRGRAAQLIGDLDSAESNMSLAEIIFTEMDLRYDLAEVRLLLASFYQQRKDPRVAVLLPQVCAAIQSGGYGFLLERERSLVYSLAGYLNDPAPQLADAAERLLEAIQGVPPRPLRIITLGKFEVWVGARMIDSKLLRQRRAGELFALLLGMECHK